MKTDDDTTTPIVEETNHPCGACGQPVPEHQEFCMHCGARQPAVAEALPETSELPHARPANEGPPLDLAALEAEAAALVGERVAFRSPWPSARRLRAEPDPALPPRPHVVVGRCTVIEARGAWVLVAHSSGVRGWCPVTSVKIPSIQRDTSATTSGAGSPPAPELATIEALERLHALHRAGGLTDDEFAKAKKLVLSKKPST
jgi:hypothetical protein